MLGSNIGTCLTAVLAAMGQVLRYATQCHPVPCLSASVWLTLAVPNQRRISADWLRVQYLLPSARYPTRHSIPRGTLSHAARYYNMRQGTEAKRVAAALLLARVLGALITLVFLQECLRDPPSPPSRARAHTPHPSRVQE